MKKVAFLLDGLGNRRHYLQFKILKTHNFRPYALIFGEYLKKGNFPQELAYLKPLPFTRNEVLRKFSPRFFLFLLTFLKKENIKVLFTHHWRFLRYALLSKIFYSDLKIIYQVVVGGTLKHPGRRLFFRLFKSKIDCLLVNSIALKEELLATKLVNPEEVEVLYTSFDLENFPKNLTKEEARSRLGLPMEAFIFGMIAKFRPEKRQKDLIEAFHRVAPKLPQAILVFLGEGPQKGECVALTKKLSLQGRIVFQGEVPQDTIPVYLRAFDALVHTSIREGMPLAVLEGLAAGLPIIATEAEGLPDIFATEEPIGYLVPKGRIDLVAQALQETYNLPKEKLLLFGKNAQKRFLTAFSPEAFAKRTLEIFSRLLS